MNPEWIGSVAGVFTTIAYIPQTLKVLRERHTTSLSLYMYILITLGIGLWCIYGFMVDSWSLIIANGISLCMSTFILVMKIRHG